MQCMKIKQPWFCSIKMANVTRRMHEDVNNIRSLINMRLHNHQIRKAKMLPSKIRTWAHSSCVGATMMAAGCLGFEILTPVLASLARKARTMGTR